MGKDHSNDRRATSFCEKIFKAICGRSRRGSHHLKKNDFPSPSKSSSIAYNSTPNGHNNNNNYEIKPFRKSVLYFPSYNHGDGPEKSFSDQEKHDSYIDAMKMKMRAPSEVWGVGGDQTPLPRQDSFNEMVSGFINHKKIKLSTTLSFGPGADIPEP